MRRVWPLTVRGTGALALALACFVLAGELGVVELVYIGLLLLAMLGVSLASLHIMHRTDTAVRSLAPEIATVGRDSRVTVRVGVRTALPSAPGVWRDTLSHGLAGAARGTFPALGSGLRGADRIVELQYTVTGARRGVHPIGPFEMRSTDPFGLTRRTNLLGERTPVTVAPAVVDLPAIFDLAGASGGTLHTSTDRIGQGADNLIARPYAPGDSMRRIHWRATAHRDALMVRQEEQESTPEATVVLDRSARRWAPEATRAPGADPAFESAVSACVSIVARLVHDGYGVEVIDSDGTVLAERIEGGDMAEVEELVTHFATVTARGDDHLPTLARVFAGATTGPVVVVTGRLDPADATALAPITHHSSLPILLSASPVADALDAAGDLGWRSASIEPGCDLVAVWSATAGRGVNHVLA